MQFMKLVFIGILGYFFTQHFQFLVDHKFEEVKESNKQQPSYVTLAQREKELDCLAKNIYYEAGTEPFEGKVAVAQVTLNRVRSREYQNTVCGVVYQRAQFSWTLDHTKRVRDTKAWHEANLIAHGVLSGRIKLPNFHALYYHTHKIKPRWSKTKQVVATIGNHIFYN